MCIPKSEDHSLEIAFAGEKKSLIAVFLHCLRMPYIPTMCLLKFTPSSPLQFLPTHPTAFPPNYMCSFFSHWVYLVLPVCAQGKDHVPEAGVDLSVPACLRKADPPSTSSHQQKDYKWRRNTVIVLVCCLSFFFFLRVNILSPEENVN